MRKLIALLTIFSLNAYAVPPVSVDSEQSAVGNYVQNTKLPNEQATQLTTRNTRIETGNTNLLKNPSFEHLTLGFGWTISNATYALNTTNQVEGKKAITLTPTAAMTFGQDSAINAANLTGLQGVASVKIKATGTTGLKVCPRNAGAAVTNLCVNVTADNTWKHISIPFILGATSNGIGIATTATGGTVIIDDAFVGTSAPFQDVSGARLMGTIKITTCASAWSNTSSAAWSSITDFSTVASCVYTSTGLASAPSTNIPAIKFASLPAGDYRLEFEGLVGSSGTSNNAQFRFSDGTNYANEYSSWNGTGSGTNQTSGLSQTISYSTTQSNITISLRGRSTGGTATATVYGQDPYPGVIKVWYFPPATKIYSQASQDYAYTNAGAITIGATTTPPTKGTIVTDRVMASRKGQNLIAEYQYEQSTAGTSGSGNYLFSLPSGLSFDTSVVKFNTGSDVAPNEALVGYATVKNNAAGNNCNAQAYDATRFRVWCGNLSGSNFLSDSFMSLGANAAFSINVRLQAPISGWSDYGVIVGSFAGIEKCANDYECTDTFSAQVSAAGVVSNENIDWINGNCTAGTTTTCTINTNLKDGTSAISSPMNCSVTNAVAGNSGRFFLGGMGSSTTTISVQEITGSTNTIISLIDSFTIKCQKGSQDYKAKSGKIATTTGVNYVPGAGAGELYDSFSVSYGATSSTACTTANTACAYLDQIGSVVTNVTRGASAGVYTLNVSKTYSKLKCLVGGSTPGSSPSFGGVAMSCSNCSSLPFQSFNSTTSAGLDSFGTLICHGKY